MCDLPIIALVDAPSSASAAAAPTSAPQTTASLRGYLDLFWELCTACSDGTDTDRRENYTVFHSSEVPSISLQSYVARVARYVDCGAEAIVLALHLAGLLMRCTGQLPSAMTAHRFMLTAMRIVTKVQHDYSRSNRAYAMAGGVPTAELQRLEVRLLHAVEFRVLFLQDDIDTVIAGFESARALPPEDRTGRVVWVARALRIQLPPAVIPTACRHMARGLIYDAVPQRTHPTSAASLSATDRSAFLGSATTGASVTLAGSSSTATARDDADPHDVKTNVHLDDDEPH